MGVIEAIKEQLDSVLSSQGGDKLKFSYDCFLSVTLGVEFSGQDLQQVWGGVRHRVEAGKYSILHFHWSISLSTNGSHFKDYITFLMSARFFTTQHSVVIKTAHCPLPWMYPICCKERQHTVTLKKRTVWVKSLDFIGLFLSKDSVEFDNVCDLTCSSCEEDIFIAHILN